ncbi:ThuA domain-containing protein [Lentisphaera profundi]|uniref:ThuA domain-containing protein n=1 Tax=Lentisphaera profundi TaxID=1658616 RepID=A0ABY7VU64_9BACT|nr:ThuA domain-containing protein [Lentisphaera profundi]WDE96294.1 ThuA domain-containing protein [Lentisphaera profundi]
MPIYIRFIILVTLCFLTVFTKVKAADSDKVQVLIVDGFSNHDWKKTTELIKTLLKEEKEFEISVATVPIKGDPVWSGFLPDFKKYKLVIQNTNDINNGNSWPLAAQKAFEKYIYEGGNMLVFHSANNAFPAWKEYNKMIGLGWRNKDFGKAIHIENDQLVLVPAGQGENTGHGKRRDLIVHKLDEHAITKDYPKQWMAADLEVYRYARGPAENMTVLSYAKDLKTEKNFPIEWIVKYGKGEIYNSTYGHYWKGQKTLPAGVRCVAFRTSFTRATRYLSDVPAKALPNNFPSSQAVELIPLET